ncbi:MAG: hypothetical protein NT010_02100 [Proteobacteria bacterium]|nr:hypothetical protein [Pseudomonadota bacterium]
MLLAETAQLIPQAKTTLPQLLDSGLRCNDGKWDCSYFSKIHTRLHCKGKEGHCQKLHENMPIDRSKQTKIRGRQKIELKLKKLATFFIPA